MERNGTMQLYSERLEGPSQAAVLFAAGRGEAAMRMLRRECEEKRAHAGPKAWDMLLELCHFLGERDEFEAVSRLHAQVYPSEAAPAWGFPVAVMAPGMARLEGVLAGMADLHGLIESTKARKTVAIDLGRLERIDFTFAPVLCALFRTWGFQSRRIILANIAELHAELLQRLGIGPHVALLRRRPGRGGAQAMEVDGAGARAFAPMPEAQAA